MVLESLNNLNIKRMVLDVPDKPEKVSLPFDVDRDITQEDWNEMRQELERYRKKDYWDHLAMQAMEMKILNPNIDLDLDEEAWDRITSALETFPKPNWLEISRHAMATKILNPTKINSYLNEERLNKIKQELEKLRNNNNDWSSFAQIAVSTKIVNPNINIGLDQKAWNGMKEELEKCRKDSNWDSFAQQAMSMRILNPNIDLNLDQQAWDEMRKELGEYKNYPSNNNWHNFAGHAMGMKILAAEEVRVTDKGIELIMPKPKAKPTKDIPPMPEVKKFLKIN